jgi:hypothetical protein
MFDPAKIVRARKYNTRMMLPMSVKCKKCRNHIFKGTKINTRKEVIGKVMLLFEFFVVNSPIVDDDDR